MENLTAYWKYYYFVTERPDMAGIKADDVRRIGGVDAMQTYLHDRAAAEYMANAGISGSPENFELSRAHITRLVTQDMYQERKME